MVSKNPSGFWKRGAAAAVLFLTLTTLVFTTTRGRLQASARPHHAAAASTQEAPPTPAARALEATARTFVEKSLRTWQERMSLKDWNIKVKLVRSSELEPQTLGNIHWDTNVKSATIEVLSSYDYTLPKDEMLKDMEFTVVHELVHLDLASLPKSQASRRIEEHAVNQLATALLSLARQ